ncbi:anti-sigma factor [Rossellomorea aquimaris]|uniref:anti-sigma factor n=1 Tax=Rossellomorea aquimaris TaxID=189382 RepID=UPI0007D077EA|nr:anti-sigma factor [Rossellomorea aquimaris]
MTQHQCDQLLDYFNGHLSQVEKAAFEKHLATCSSCQEELIEYQQLADYLPYATNPIEPPKGLEERVFSHIFKEENPTHIDIQREPRSSRQKRMKWIFPSVAAIFALSLIGNIYLYNEINNEVKPPTTEQATIDKVLKSVNLAAVEGEATGTASLIQHGEQTSMVIQASQLKSLSNNEVYQVWLIKDDKPERAGTFISTKDGKGSVVYSISENLTEKDWDTVAITLEPDANSQTPKGSIVLASEL